MSILNPQKETNSTHPMNWISFKFFPPRWPNGVNMRADNVTWNITPISVTIAGQNQEGGQFCNEIGRGDCHFCLIPRWKILIHF